MIVELLIRTVKSIEKQGIEYMLSGSIALSYYSVPRMTLDIDLVIELKTEHAELISKILNGRFYFNKQTIIEEIKRKGMFNAIDFETGYKIDFIIKKEDEYRLLEFKRKQKVWIEGCDVWIVSPEDLVISKLIWIQQLESDKQITDIRNLLSIKNLDMGYIKSWCNHLNIKTFGLFKNE